MIVINKFSVVDAAHKIGAVKLSIAFLIYLEMIEFFNRPIIWLLPRTRGSSSLSTITIITAIFMRNRNILKSTISIVIYASRNRHRSTSISIFLVNAEEVESLINLSEIEYVYQKKYVKDNKLELNISVMPLESKLIEITYE